jgi:LPS-assembly lipoprotein
MQALRAVFLVCLVMMLAACGFRLQGVASFPPELAQVYLDVADPNSDLAFQLRRSLAAAGVSVVGNEADATATLRIEGERYGRRVKSVSAQNRPTEYEVFYMAEFLVETPEQTLLPRERVNRQRVFPYDETEILGKQQEEEMLRDAIAREIAGVITRRMAGLGN